MKVSISFKHSNGVRNKYSVEFSKKKLVSFSKQKYVPPLYKPAREVPPPAIKSDRQKMIGYLQECLGDKHNPIVSPEIREADGRFYYVWKQTNGHACGLAALLNIYQCSSVAEFVDDILPKVGEKNLEDIEYINSVTRSLGGGGDRTRSDSTQLIPVNLTRTRSVRHMVRNMKENGGMMVDTMKAYFTDDPILIRKPSHVSYESMVYPSVILHNGHYISVDKDGENFIFKDSLHDGNVDVIDKDIFDFYMAEKLAKGDLAVMRMKD